MCYHPFWLLKVSEPDDTGMISDHREMSPSKIVLEEFQGSHHREQLFIGSAVSLLAAFKVLDV